MERLKRIQIDPKICSGEPVIRGTRITVRVIFKLLANNKSIEEIIEIYPELEVLDIQEAIEYGNRLVSLLFDEDDAI